jgi:hypothetical protein
MLHHWKLDFYQSQMPMANVIVNEIKIKIGYIYDIQITPTYSIRKKSYLKPSLWKKDARKLAEEYWQKYLNE